MPHILSVVDNHSLAPSLLRGGWCLDAGSRGLRLAKWLVVQGCKVIALDPGEDDAAEGVIAHKAALVHSALSGRNVTLMEMDDKEARYISPQGGSVYGISIPVLMHDYKIDKWDLIKLNIEGSEYDILDEIGGPISKQIVFSFHEHTDRARGRAECDRIIDKLRQWYDIHNQVWEQRYSCRENYWDILAIEKGI